MKIVFVTGFVTFHQIALWDSFVSSDGEFDFVYLSTSLPKKDSLINKIGYNQESRTYIKTSYTLSDSELDNIFDKCDVLVYSSSFDKRVFRYFKNAKHFVFMTEHFTKTITPKSLCSMIVHFMKMRISIGFKKTYLLANSYYSKLDYNFSLFCFNKTYRFGYFPKIIESNNDKDPFSIIWLGRMISWKRPKLALNALEEFKKIDSRFHLTFIGDGIETEKIKNEVNKLGLNTSVSFAGFKSNEETIELLSKSRFFLFTSNRQEGFGVPLLEAMSQGCVCFASKSAGATRFLIEDGVSGFAFSNKRKLKDKIHDYFKNEGRFLNIGFNAKETIRNCWSPEIAGKRLALFLKAIYLKERFDLFKKGPISRY